MILFNGNIVPVTFETCVTAINLVLLVISFFIFGLILVSTIKNETRKLQKEISNLQFSLNTMKITLHEANLDHQYLTSPDNIDKLAKKYR